MPQGDSDLYRFPVKVPQLVDLIREHYRGDPRLMSLLEDLEPMFWDRDVTLEDFLSNAPAIPSTGYDAMVIRGATDDDDTRTYGTVFAAMEALDAAGFLTARIGVVARGTAVAEVANLGTMATLRSVDICGVDGGDDDTTWGKFTPWSLNTRTTTGTGSSFSWRLHGMSITIASGKTVFFQGANVSVEGHESEFNGTGGATSTVAPTICANGGQLYDCTTVEINLEGFFCFGCEFFWSVNASHTSTLSVFTYGCYYEWSGATAITFTATGGTITSSKCVHILGATFGHTGPHSSGATTDVLTLTCSGTNAGVVITGGGDRGGIGSLDVSVTGHGNCYIDVVGRNCTVAAGTSTTTWPSQAHVGGVWSGTVDVTGGCELDVAAERLVIRGKGVTGTAGLTFNAASGTAFTGTSATDFALVIGARRHPGQASSTQKGYALDAGCTRGVVIFVGSNDFPTADTNAGSSIVIIDENGVPVAAHASTHLPGGSDALTTATPVAIGSALAEGVAASFARSDHVHILADILTAGGPTGSATVVPVITWDAKGRLTAVTTATISGVVPRKATVTIGDGASTTLVATHSFGTTDVVDVLRDASTNEKVNADTTVYNTNDVTYTFLVAPALNSLEAVMIG